MLFAAAGGAEVIDAFLVDGEEAHGRAVFGSHVGDGGAVHDGQRGRAGAEEFDEFADDLGFAQHLRDGQHEVGGGDAFLERAGEMDADDFRREEINRLAEHAGLGLDAADAPADHAEAVDHGGVRVRADERVGIIDGPWTFPRTGRPWRDIRDSPGGRCRCPAARRRRSRRPACPT